MAKSRVVKYFKIGGDEVIFVRYAVAESAA